MTDLTIADVEEIKRFLLVTREDILTWLPPAWEPGWKSEAASELRNTEIGENAPWGKIRSGRRMQLPKSSYTRPWTALTRWLTL